MKLTRVSLTVHLLISSIRTFKVITALISGYYCTKLILYDHCTREIFRSNTPMIIRFQSFSCEIGSQTPVMIESEWIQDLTNAIVIRSSLLFWKIYDHCRSWIFNRIFLCEIGSQTPVMIDYEWILDRTSAIDMRSSLRFWKFTPYKFSDKWHQVFTLKREGVSYYETHDIWEI